MGLCMTIGRDSLESVDLTNTDARNVIPNEIVENAKSAAKTAAGLLLFGANTLRDQVKNDDSALQHFMNRCD